MKVAHEIDRLLDERLGHAQIPASNAADDAEFLRRVTLDLTGRIPTYDEAIDFLDSEDSGKRQRLIDGLLARESYGHHFAEIWRELIEPRDTGSTKVARDTFSPWLAERFNRNRGWNEIVTELLTVEGKIRDLPQAKFILSNSMDFEPQPNQLTDATARLFWGVQLRCAECHDHPFALWTQSDFWSTAAFFSRLRKGYTDGKNPQGWTLTEAKPDDDVNRQFTKLLAAPDVAGPAIVVPSAGGKLADIVVKGRFLGGAEVEWTDAGPFRERFAAWATSREHPWFTANAVNRMWAHLFGRGLVNPLDDLRDTNPPSHPELLKLLADEFAAAEFDLKHLLRIICNTNAYQRTSRPLMENASDVECFSHMTMKVIPPTALYDSLSIVLYPVAPKTDAGNKQSSVRLNPIPNVSRVEFVRFFAARPDENSPSIMNQGIPQFLRMMNAVEVNSRAPGLARLSGKGDVAHTIDLMFLAVYARRPTPDEKGLLTAFINDSKEHDPIAGALWALINSSEFVLNH